MLVGNRLRELRESKNLSQGDIEKRTGLLRCYISRVENGHTVPAVETLEKMARALEIPMYRLFHAGEVPAGLSKMKPPKDDEFGSKGREADYFSKLRRLLAKMEGDLRIGTLYGFSSGSGTPRHDHSSATLGD
jgi:transcriptional regulator with XRE-family HTH domain